MTAQVTDFSRSYVRWSVAADPTDDRQPGHMPWGNSVRIQIDAICTIEGPALAEPCELRLIAPCRKEWMYRDTELIMDPGAEYRVIFANDRQRDVAMSARATGDRPLPATVRGFLSLEFERADVAAEALLSDEAVVRASESGRPILAKTRIVREDGALTATLEYPIRTMNYHPDRRRFQVDTGPLIFPDLDTVFDHPIDCCRLAHTVYNTFEYAEFVCRSSDRRELTGDGAVRLAIYEDHYRVGAEHQLFAIQ